jgi:hypothetical protein
VAEHPITPDYSGACISNVVPALVNPLTTTPAWLPEVALGAQQTVLLALDGLGWDQLQERRSMAPTLAGMQGGPITTVVPSTTSTAMTSLTTGMTPGEHGIIGYRIHVHH